MRGALILAALVLAFGFVAGVSQMAAAAAELERRQLAVAGVAALGAERAAREEDAAAVAALDALHRVALVDLAPESRGLHDQAPPWLTRSACDDATSATFATTRDSV